MSTVRLTARPRDHAASVIVSALSAAFGVVLIEATVLMSTAVAADPMGQSGTVRLALTAVSSVFIMIAVYVGAIVTANTFSTVIAGRTRQIALLRLIGAKAAGLRRAVAVEGLVVGVIGAVIGMLVGLTVAGVTVWIGIAQGWLPDLYYPLLDPMVAVPVVIVALTTWAAAWVGSRRVSTVTPLAATGASVEPAEASARPARAITMAVLLAIGFGLLALGVVTGLVSPLGLLVAFFGGVISFTGIIVGAPVIMPPLLRLAGRLLGTRPSAVLAAQNSVRHPQRSSRATIGLVIGVTLVIMFAVAMQSYQAIVLGQFEDDPVARAAVEQSLTVTTGIFAGLVGFSAVIAAVGMVNNLSLNVLQRTRELGLLRALGFTAGQVRTMVLAESVQMVLASVGFGLVLGIGYGWAAAQSLLGSLVHGIVAPALPWPLLAAIVLAAAVFAILASVAPSRRATRVSPVAALAIE